MRQGYTHIAMVLDRSGSMTGTRDDTIGGVNRFIADQKSAPGQATLTLGLFDHEYHLVHDATNIKDARPLTRNTYQPRGTTALLDAIGRTIDRTGEHLQGLEESDRPEKVLFVIVTDGQENASQNFTIEKINKKIEHQRAVYKWEFVFLGANQDAITSASKIGISAGSTMTYAANSFGTASAFASTSSNATVFRAAQCDAFTFHASDRNAQTKAGVDPLNNAVPKDAA